MTGPLGRYEDPVFAHGTNELLRYISSRTSQGATTVLAGSDTASAAQACGATSFSHISLGGSSTLMMLAGKPLPGVDAIPDENNI
jgi:phosphoglycerate kinase